MPESTLAVTFDEIEAAVSRLLYGTRNPESLQGDDREDLRDVIKGGLRRFYYPASAGIGLNHQWTFLKPEFSFTTAADQADYEMGPDFGGVIGSLYFDEDAGNAWGECRKVDVSLIQRYRGSATSIATGYPTQFAERRVSASGSQPQRWELLMWPTADAEYTLRGRMFVNPNAIDENAQHPYGGVEHGETILESCLAVAEQRLTGAGPHQQAFVERLKASIQRDQQASAPDFIGYNGERLMTRARGGLARVWDDRATVGGVYYEG